jgi:CBS-domain-containing membrane protein
MCDPEDPVQKVCGQIIMNHVGSCLVFDQHRKDFIGIVTKTDICQAHWDGVIHHSKNEAKAKDIMSYGLLACQDSDDVSVVIALIARDRVHHVIVKDNDKSVVGLVTALDCAQALLKQKGSGNDSFRGLFSKKPKK